jgi:predicted glycoside hydrolase/deacetylase ChbG (UPF0249 family)
MLIVNADDWGMDRATTEAIVQAFVTGRITETSAMVYMEDSKRASERASEIGVPLGLHVNLTDPFTDPSVPHTIRNRHDRVRLTLTRSPLRRWLFDPTALGPVTGDVSQQVEAFTDLYGQPPAHITGHRHMHMCATSLFGGALPIGAKVRPVYTYFPGEKPLFNRAIRRVWNGVARRRFRCPEHLFSLREMHPALGGKLIDMKLELAFDRSVEVVAHPGEPDEQKVLMSDDWEARFAAAARGTYENL